MLSTPRSQFEGEDTVHWALDTNLAMSQAVRRMVSGCVELANGRLWLPERALVLMSTRYAMLARTRATRITEHGEGADPFGFDADALDDLVVERSVALTRAFARWAVEETRRNDGLWSLARATPDTERTAQRLFVAGIARAGEDGTAEEDAHVAAEALEAGGVRQICEIACYAQTRRSQKSSKRLLSTAQRRAMMALAPATLQRMPPRLRRVPMMCLQPPSTTPVATHRPTARNFG